jgi:AcrR family transcriptional regulator
MGLAVESADGSRRAEILETAAAVFAQSGVRTSLKDVADACGILPGSLYHHFESKDAIVVELVARYEDEIDDLANQAADALRNSARDGARDLVVGLATAIAACAARHRGALLLTLYESRTGASEELVRSATQPRQAIVAAMLETLRAAQRAGALRPGVTLPTLAERLCQSMLHVGIGMLHGGPGDARMPAIMCHLLLDGLAVRPPEDAELDRSEAFAAANRAIDTWPARGGDAEDGEDDRVAKLRAVARAEFGRRGYKATTIRDLAAAAGLGTASVYRLIGSKEELLVSVMQSFAANITAGWQAVLDSASTTIEKLDALMWVDINVLDRFSEEFTIQLGWLLDSPPATADLAWSFTTRLREVKALLRAGARSGEIQLPRGSSDGRAQCVLELIWMPETLVRAGTRPALAFGRDTLVRGAATRS